MIPMPRALAVPIVVATVVLVPPPATAECPPGVYFGNPRAMFTGSNPLFQVIADFNADGHMDIAVANSNFLGGGTSNVSVFIGLGQGNFGPPDVFTSGTQPHGIVTGDFDEDGALDLAVANTVSQSVSIHRGIKSGGLPTGTFSAGVPYATAGQPFQMVVGDYNEDGILDLAVAINNVGRVSVLIGQGTGGVGNGTFAAPQTYPLANLSLAIEQGDFNSDGIVDLVATEYTSGTVALLKGQGTGGVGNGTFAAAVHYTAGIEPFDLAVLDFDEDGNLDLVVANANNGGIRLLRGSGTGAFTSFGALPSGNTSGVTTVDIDQDDILDLVSSESNGARRLRIFQGQGSGGVGNGSYVEKLALGMPTDPYQINVADLNGDPYPDLVVTQFLTSDLSVVLGNCETPSTDPRFPVLTDVRDVPEDEGGRVYLTWLRSSLDATNGTVTSYRVWRRIPPLEGATTAPQAAGGEDAVTTRTERGPDGETLVTFWEAIATLPAERLEGYGYTAPTTEDSSASHPVSTAFFVSALTANPAVTYPSNVDSGASIDNLPPGPPGNLRSVPGQSKLVLQWSPVSAPDVIGYRLYRGSAAGFPIDETTFVDEVADTTSPPLDAAGAPYFQVTAVDVHGNEGPPSNVFVQGTVGTGGTPPALALAHPRPNPTRRSGEVTLAITLPNDDPASLAVFDVAGRCVAAPSLAGLGAGDHVVRLNPGERLRAGIYWVRLAHGARSIERKLVLLD